MNADSGDSGVDGTRLRDAVGRNAEYYLPRWQAMRAKGSNRSWNWAACLLNVYWLAWRKMWGPLILLLLAFLLLGAIGAAVPRVEQLTFLASIGLTFLAGAYGNHLYRRHCERLVAATSSLPADEAQASLKQRGGTSALALVVALVLTLLLVALAVAGPMAQPPRETADREAWRGP